MKKHHFQSVKKHALKVTGEAKSNNSKGSIAGNQKETLLDFVRRSPLYDSEEVKYDGIMMKKASGLGASFKFAFNGLLLLLKTQRNARIHLGFTFGLLILGLVLKFNRLDWALMAIAVTSVWAAEAFNTAIELLADRLHPRQHPQIGAVKDVAAAAVLIAVVGAVILGMLVVAPYVFNR